MPSTLLQILSADFELLKPSNSHQIVLTEAQIKSVEKKKAKPPSDGKTPNQDGLAPLEEEDPEVFPFPNPRKPTNLTMFAEQITEVIIGTVHLP